MTMEELVENYVLCMLSLNPTASGHFSDYSEMLRYVDMRKRLEPYINDFIARYEDTRILTTSDEVVGALSGADAPVNHLYISSPAFSVSVFRKRYGSYIPQDASDTDTRRVISSFVEQHGMVFMWDGTYKTGFDRRHEIIRLDKDGVVFIDSRLWTVYLDKTFVNPHKFASYLSNIHELKPLILRLFPSIEKDRQQVNDDGDLSVVFSSRQRHASSIRSAIDKADKIETTKLIYSHLLSWFANGRNSNIVFVTENKRVMVLSILMDRFCPTKFGSPSIYNVFNGKNFDVSKNSYTIKNDNVCKELGGNSFECRFNIGPIDKNVNNAWFTTPTYVANDAVYLQDDKLRFASKQGKDPTGINTLYNSFGVVDGQYNGSDVVKYYGYIFSESTPDDDPVSDDMKRVLSGTAQEYMMGDEVASFTQFCTIAMSGFDGKWTAYDKFCDYIDYCYRSNVDSLVEYADGVYKTLVDARYIKEETA